MCPLGLSGDDGASGLAIMVGSIELIFRASRDSRTQPEWDTRRWQVENEQNTFKKCLPAGDACEVSSFSSSRCPNSRDHAKLFYVSLTPGGPWAEKKELLIVRPERVRFLVPAVAVWHYYTEQGGESSQTLHGPTDTVSGTLFSVCAGVRGSSHGRSRAFMRTREISGGMS